ncbi:MAG: hypothetical protein RL329_3819 [Bacteroidota bacterium]
MLERFNAAQPSNHRPSVWERYSSFFKAAIILFLVIVMQIPIQMISALLSERSMRQRTAAAEMSVNWGLEQTVTGPILSVPYYINEDENGKSVRKLVYAHVLPATLNVNGTILPEKLHRRVYEVVVYNSKNKFSGEFDLKKFNSLNIPASDIVWDKCVLGMGISDLRGIEERIKLKWNQVETEFGSGVGANWMVNTGVHVPVAVSANAQTNYTFEFDLELKGTAKLYFVPVGAETKVKMTSKWTTPSFTGAYLPAIRRVTKEGFTADWKVSNLNRQYPQMWKHGSHPVLESSAFGVNLMLSNDHYAKIERTIKYSFLLIALTFMVFFFMEVLNRKKVHPFQYILIGLAMCIFYSLLLSFSEHLNFDIAYFVAALMTVGLIGFYTMGIFKDKKYAMGVTSILAGLYVFVFVVVRMEEQSLLMGSVGLFVVLAAVMYLSREVDWYNLKTKQEPIE